MDDEPVLTDEKRKQIIEIWKTVVEVQQHFNDIGMRIRSAFVTILLALFASIGFLLDKKLSLEVGPINLQFAILVPLFGVLGTLLFYFIDRYWYHRLLVGAVKHGISIETKYKKEMPELSLTEAIGKESPYKPRLWVVRWLAKRVVTHEKYHETGQLHSDAKIELFYKSVVLALFLTTIISRLTRRCYRRRKLRSACRPINSSPCASAWSCNKAVIADTIRKRPRDKRRDSALPTSAY
jgi:hypothetical protein